MMAREKTAGKKTGEWFVSSCMHAADAEFSVLHAPRTPQETRWPHSMQRCTDVQRGTSGIVRPPLPHPFALVRPETLLAALHVASLICQSAYALWSVCRSLAPPVVWPYRTLPWHLCSVDYVYIQVFVVILLHSPPPRAVVKNTMPSRVFGTT